MTMKMTMKTQMTVLGTLTIIATNLALSSASLGMSENTGVKSHAALSKAKVKKAKVTRVVMYECPMCHERVTAPQALKQHMLCSCCNMKLVALK